MSSGETRTTPVEMYCPTCDRSFKRMLELCPHDGTKLVRIMTARRLTGRDIDGRFDVHELIGEGGMGAVYRGFQRSVGRDVAIKVIEPRRSGSPAIAKRFLREAKLASRLSHPNVVTIIDFGQTEEGALFLVMELVRGRTLGRVLKQDGPFPIERLVGVSVQLCDALECAHRLSIVHRDLKPSNIMILDEPAGRDLVKVLDFGLAKSLSADEHQPTVTSSDMIVGTPRYMPPEAITGTAGPRSDLYSLGVILYEIVAGRPLFDARTLSDVIAMHALAPTPELPAHAPPALKQLLERLLAKSPDDRPTDAAEVRETLLGLVEGPSTGSSRARLRPALPLAPAPTPAPAPGVAGAAGLDEGPLTRMERPWPARPRRLWLVALLVAAAAAAVAAAAALVLTNRRSVTPAVPAPASRAARPYADAGLSVTPLVPLAPDAGIGALPMTADSAAPLAGAAPDAAPAARAPAQIELDLRSTPRATVSIGGRVVGTTPLRHRLPAGRRAVVLVLTRRGYRPYRERIVPDRDRILDVSLVRASRPPGDPKFPF